jgi:phosphatidylinositol alpha-mannosyltransferase
VWVVSTHATDGGPAAAAHRPYSCWIGTTVESEWRGRSVGIGRIRREAARASIPFLVKLERRVLSSASSVFATSPSSRAAVAAACSRNDVEILPIPVDVDQFSPAPDLEWQKTFERPVLVFVGRADDPRKNVKLLIEVARRLPSVRVLLVGSPPNVLLPANVEATGAVGDVSAVLRNATLFVLPSRQEGFGIAAVEALATGLPVVTTPNGGTADVVRASGGGRVTETFDAEDFAEAVQTLLADPDAAAAMRRRGREFAVRAHSPSALREALSTAVRRERP